MPDDRAPGGGRRLAPPAPHLPCALRDRGAPGRREIRARTVTTALRERIFRRNVRVAGLVRYVASDGGGVRARVTASVQRVAQVTGGTS